MRILIILSLAMAAMAEYSGGWDPRYCCYPVPEECCPTDPCPPCLDVAIVLDISSSIGTRNYEDFYIPFIMDFVNSPSWSIGPNDDQYRVSLTTFSTCVEIVGGGLVFGCDVLVNWGDAASMDASLFFDAIPDDTEIGTTNTGQALKDTREQVLMGPGNRDFCADACLVVTDGAENHNATFFEAELAKFHMNCNTVIAVGVTSSVPLDELERIAGTADHSFPVDDFSQLEALLPTLEGALCNNGGSGGASGCCPYEYPTYFHLMGY